MPERTPQDIETPALLVDLNAMEQNLRTMARFFCNRPARLRPHFKNHRVLELAERQMELGAIGITCARLWQAERLVRRGIRSVLIANEVAGDGDLRRFVELSREAPVLLAVDHEEVVRELGRLARSSGVQLNVVVDVELGLKRCGVAPGQPAAELAKAAVAEGLQFRGLMGYEGHLQLLAPGSEKETVVSRAMQSLADTRALIEAEGIPVSVVSCGGTGDYRTAGSYPGITENQAGSYLLMDRSYAAAAPDFHETLVVLATVISVTPGERIVVDAGVKAVSGERGLPVVKNMPGLRLRALHAEHAPIDILEPGVALKPGDRIELAVHYHDATVNLHRRMFGVRNGVVEREFTIEH